MDLPMTQLYSWSRCGGVGAQPQPLPISKSIWRLCESSSLSWNLLTVYSRFPTKMTWLNENEILWKTNLHYWALIHWCIHPLLKAPVIKLSNGNGARQRCPNYPGHPIKIGNMSLCIRQYVNSDRFRTSYPLQSITIRRHSRSQSSPRSSLYFKCSL